MLTLEYRPKTFRDLAGQDLVKKALLHIVKDPANAPRTLLLCGKFGTGKCQPKDSIIPTPYGDRRFGDLKVGDLVFGSDGEPTKVIGVYDRGTLPVYRVFFNGGAFLDVGADHLWNIQYSRDHAWRYNGKFITKTVDTLTLQSYLKGDLKFEHQEGKPFIQLTQPLNYIDVHEPICNPYVIGALIADGTLDSEIIGYTKFEEPVAEYMKSLITLNEHSLNNPDGSYTVPKVTNPEVYEALVHYDLHFKKSGTKFIHPDLFRMSIENRIKLLQGLMDGDGSPERYDRKECSLVSYASTSKQLILDVERLVTSLGGFTKVHKDKDCWRVTFKLDFNPFLKSNWASRIKQRKVKVDRNRRYITDIKELPACEQQCIKVDASDELYIGDCQYNLVTHNTTCARIFARALNCKHKLPNGDACGRPDCDICGHDIQDSMFYDEYDSAIVGGVDSIRELRNTFYFGYPKGYKVIVLDEIHLISKTAQGALLKVLEEPESNVFFLLCTTDPEKLLNTIVSRSFSLSFEGVEHDAIVNHLKKIMELKEPLNLPPEKIESYLHSIAARSNGHMRNAMMLLDNLYLLKEDFDFLVRDSSILFINLFKTCLLFNAYASVKGEETTQKSIDYIISQLASFPIAHLRQDYAKLLLEIVTYTFKKSEDPNIEAITKDFKNTYSLIGVLNDPTIFNMFTDDIHFKVAMIVLSNKLKTIKRG